MWFSSVYLKTLRDYRIAIFRLGHRHGPAHVHGHLRRPASDCHAGGPRRRSSAWRSRSPGSPSRSSRYGRRLRHLEIRVYDSGDGPLADSGGQPHAARRRRARLDGRLALAAGGSRAGGAGETGRDVDGADPDRAADRAADLCRRRECERRLWPGRCACSLASISRARSAASLGALALLLSQFTQDARTAAGITGGLLALAIVVDMIHRVVPDTDWLSRLSPVYYYNLSKPLIPSYGTDPVALLVMVALRRCSAARRSGSSCGAMSARRWRCPAG